MGSPGPSAAGNDVAEARDRRPPIGVALIHRLGRRLPTEVSVATAVSSPHRADAFEAGRRLIDTFKATVPIWKKECRPDGSEGWVHPARPPQETTQQEPA